MANPRWSVRAVLIGGNVILALVAVASVVAAGSSVLHRRADEEALTRASMAASAATRIVDRTRDRLADSVRSFSEASGVLSLVDPGRRDALVESLTNWCKTAELTGCAVVTARSVVGAGAAWNEIPASAIPTANGLLAPRHGPPLVLAASAPLRGSPGAWVLGVLALDDAFQKSLTKQIGLPVTLIARDAALASEGVSESLREARIRALDSESEVTLALGDSGSYIAIEPLAAREGALLGFLETTLPGGPTARAARRSIRSLIGFSLLVGGIAAFFGVMLTRRLVTPLEGLIDASERIGRGDLAAAVPGHDSTELGRLAGALDGMRARLMELTSELRRRQAQAEAVAAGMLEGVYAVDRSRIIRFVNPQAAGLLGLPSSQIVGRFCGDVLMPRTEGRLRPCEDRCPILHARFRGNTRAVEHLELPAGLRTVVITSSAPETKEGEADLQFQVIRGESDTEATRRLRDAVLANISHEFRTPLSAQLASIELLRDRLEQIEPKEVRDLVMTLERGTLRLTQLIDNLLESVRIESGTDSIRRKPVALDEIVESAVDMASPLAELREQTIQVDLPYPLPVVSGDGPRLVQVFVNLLANASKFAPVRTAIRIGGEVRAAEVVLWVEDEGPGLRDLEQNPGFERFRRSRGEEPEESGMGLGLFIVKSIVERHGGRVEARGGGGEGEERARTRVCVVLPTAATDVTGATDSAGGASA